MKPYIIQDPINRLTIGIQVTDGGKVYIATALCNWTDQYVRAVGCAKVIGRLDQMLSRNAPPLGTFVPRFDHVPAETWHDRLLPIIHESLDCLDFWGTGKLGKDKYCPGAWAIRASARQVLLDDLALQLEAPQHAESK